MNDKTADREMLAVSGFVVVKAQPAGHTVQRLPGEAAQRRRRAEGVAALPPRLVAQLGNAHPRLIGRDCRAAQVVGRQPAHRAIDSQRNPLTAGLVVLRNRRAAAADGCKCNDL